MHTRKIDLNLLVVLEAILAERNVTRAAERLHISQPALSHALARLRVALKDPMLVRERGTMVPTPKALRMEAPLRAVLRQLEGILSTLEDFDPALLEETIHLGATDYADFVLMPAVVELLRAKAPALKVIVRDIAADHLGEHLSTGKIDMAIAFSADQVAGLHEDVLFADTYVCIGRRTRVKALTLDQYLAAKHVQVSHRGLLGGVPDQTLAARGLSRDVVISTPHFMAAASIVARTDLLMTTPRRVGERLVSELPVRLYEPPYQLPKIEFKLVWHGRTHAEAGQQWVRGMMRDAAAGLPGTGH